MKIGSECLQLIGLVWVGFKLINDEAYKMLLFLLVSMSPPKIGQTRQTSVPHTKRTSIVDGDLISETEEPKSSVK